MATQRKRKTKKRSRDERVFVGIILFFAVMMLLLVLFIAIGGDRNDASVSDPSETASEGSSDISESYSENVTDSEVFEESTFENDMTYFDESEFNGSEETSTPDETSSNDETSLNDETTSSDETSDVEVSAVQQEGSWATKDGEYYYILADGSYHIGWLEKDGDLYYLQEDGTAAQGETVIDGKTYFFSEKGKSFIVVNPWNYIPEGFEPDLVDLPSNFGTSEKVDRSCYEALIQMLTDCQKAGHNIFVVSSYRTNEFQTYNFNRKVKQYLDLGYSQEDAETAAAEWVAVPGTSEHQLGLAVDIIDTEIWELTEAQAELDGQKWLMENCWKYGFILRYPKDTKNETGINYEPWHYRYFGTEIAAEIHESGMTVETYLKSLAD